MFYSPGSRTRPGRGPHKRDSGGLQLLSEGVVAAAATLDLVLTGHSKFRGIRVVLSNIIPVTDATPLTMRVSTDGGGSFDAGAANYRYAVQEIFVGTPPGTAMVTSLSATSIVLSGPTSIGNDTFGGLNFILDFFDHTSAAYFPRFRFRGTYYAADDNIVAIWGGGRRQAAQITNAVRFLFGTGNIASGRHAVYGWT
jgi:hypothetical protein